MSDKQNPGPGSTQMSAWAEIRGIDMHYVSRLTTGGKDSVQHAVLDAKGDASRCARAASPKEMVHKKIDTLSGFVVLFQGDDYFSPSVSLFAISDRLGYFAQRVTPINDGGDLTGFHELAQDGQVDIV